LSIDCNRKLQKAFSIFEPHCKLLFEFSMPENHFASFQGIGISAGGFLLARLKLKNEQEDAGIGRTAPNETIGHPRYDPGLGNADDLRLPENFKIQPSIFDDHGKITSFERVN
jgi:hypothetical protein